MPTEDENIQYLYLILTDGNPTIDWDAVGTDLDLSKGAVSKRWSRLKTAMEKGNPPGGSTYQFLWLCVKHTQRSTPQNWAEIAKKCNTTVGAASKRYSRMKKAFEENQTASGASPLSPAKSTPAKPKNTPKSTPKKTAKASNETQASPAGAKRKRVTDTTPTTTEDAELMPALDADEELPDVKLKRTKVGKNKVKVTPKPKAKTTIKKEISEDDAEDAFYDAEEGIGEGVVAAESTHESMSPSDSCAPPGHCEQCACTAKEIADISMDRNSGVAQAQRVELEEILGAVNTS